jgi:RNA polymerase sigma-70 factor (ECF subfamily)
MNPQRPRRPYTPSSTVVMDPGTPGGHELVPDDVAIMRRMAQGDDRALGSLYDHWHSLVYAVVLRIVRQQKDVEDVVEETFWQAWRQAGRYDPSRGSVATWLLTIARSRALDRVRALKRLREESLESERAEEVAQQVSDSDPGRDAEAAERRKIVVSALAQLPTEQREALVLGYFGGLSQSEIAEQTGQPLGTIKTRIRLAMQKLRSSLQILHEEPL